MQKNKFCVLLTQKPDDIPFDLKHHRHIIYEGKINVLKPKLIDELTWLKNEVAKKRSETFSVKLIGASGLPVKEDWRAIGEMDLALEIHNNGQSRSPEIEAIYFHTSTDWNFSQDGVDCSSNAGDTDKSKRHFLKSPIVRLSPGAWAPIKLAGKKTFWNKYKGTELKDKYSAKGVAMLEIITSEGNFRHSVNLNVEFDEYPF